MKGQVRVLRVLGLGLTVMTDMTATAPSACLLGEEIGPRCRVLRVFGLPASLLGTWLRLTQAELGWGGGIQDQALGSSHKYCARTHA